MWSASEGFFASTEVINSFFFKFFYLILFIILRFVVCLLITSNWALIVSLALALCYPELVSNLKKLLDIYLMLTSSLCFCRIFKCNILPVYIIILILQATMKLNCSLQNNMCFCCPAEVISFSFWGYIILWMQLLQTVQICTKPVYVE